MSPAFIIAASCIWLQGSLLIKGMNKQSLTHSQGTWGQLNLPEGQYRERASKS